MRTWNGERFIDNEARFPNVDINFGMCNPPEWDDETCHKNVLDRYVECFKRIMQGLRYEGALPEELGQCQLEFMVLFMKPIFTHREFMAIAHKWVTII